jgi:hypothetical protein
MLTSHSNRRLPVRQVLDPDSREFYVRRVDLIRAWRPVSAARTAFSRAFRTDSDLPAWTYDRETGQVLTGPSARHAAATVLYLDWDFTNEQQRNEARQLFGVVAASEATVEAACALNVAKQHFKAAWEALVPYTVREAAQERPTPAVRLALGSIDTRLRRLNYHSSTREVVVLERLPVRVAFTRRQALIIKRLSVEEALALVERDFKHSSEHFRMRRMLERLPPHTPLARRVLGSDTIVTNLKFRSSLERNPGEPFVRWDTQQLTSGQPLLLRLDSSTEFPEVTGPRDRGQSRGERRPRNDRTIEQEPYIAALHLHRYASRHEATHVSEASGRDSAQ